MFQVEKRAVKFVALASKTYVCIGLDDEVKLSCKGVNKQLVAKQNPFSTFKRVLDSGKAEGSVNVGFRVLQDRVYTYSCIRNAFPYFYVKRNCVTSCGTYTEPYFDLILNPVPKLYVCVYTDIPECSMDHELTFEMDSLRFKTIRQAHCFKKLASMFMRLQNGSNNLVGVGKRNNHKILNIMKDILNTTNPWSLHQIERHLVPSSDFYANEFDVLYNILCAKMTAYPQIAQTLNEVSGKFVVNTCRFNTRIGSGVSPRQTRWEKGGYLCGGNMWGHVIMSSSVMLKDCCFSN